VQAYALAFPAVSFLLRDAGREVLSYPVSRLDDRVEIVLGSELSGRMAKVEHEEGALRVSGYASKPDFTRSNRSLQYFFVNRRFVKDRLLSHAVSQAYESLIPRNSYPALVLFVSIPPGGIDVNVHPAKAEVRFRDEAELHRVVRSAIRGAIGAARAGFAEAVEAAYGAIFPEGGSGAADAAAAIPRELFIAFGDEGGGSLETAGGSALREAPVSLFGAERPSAALSTGGLYWQLHQSFILIQIRGGLVIIDQHAAHERVLFDRARASLPGTRALSQSLLFPAAITLSPDEFERYESLGRTLDSLGFETEPFGPRSLIVRGIPAGVRNWNDGRLLQEILGEGRSGVDGFLRSYACRAAIKAGTRLSAEEMESLADQLFATELPYTCPHGRPTMLRVGLAELERRFARSVSPERT
jgi:DNA mismatch repair protein MutL